MGEVIREAGWPIFPILALGSTTLYLSLKLAAFPQRSLRPLVIGLGAATLLMGILGTVLGIQASARAIPQVPPEMRFIFLVGLKESLNCLVAALVLLLPSAIAVAAGSHRLTRRLEEIALRS